MAPDGAGVRQADEPSARNAMIGQRAPSGPIGSEAQDRVEPTDQESFWAGEFGDAYSRRNVGEALVAANTALFAHILARAGAVDSVLELGAGTGLNMLALRRLLPDAQLSAVEINPYAQGELRRIGNVEVFATSVLRFEPGRTWDLVLTKGLLIHVDPSSLPAVYETIHRASRRHVCIAEYYSPSPVEVPYRGHSGRLFKRDFAGEMLALYPDLVLRDYGFVYRRDPHFPQDDITWFLLERAPGPGAGG